MENKDLKSNDNSNTEGDNKQTIFKEHGADVIYQPNFFSKEESKKIFESLKEEQYDPVLYFFSDGKVRESPRVMAWYADDLDWTYYFGKQKDGMKARQFTPTLIKIKERVEQFTKEKFNACLVNLYRNHKDKIDKHADKDPWLGIDPTIPSLSFGAVRKFVLSNFKTKQNEEYQLQDGSMLVMQGTTQQFWVHSIPKASASSCSGERFNITFRKVIPELVHLMKPGVSGY